MKTSGFRCETKFGLLVFLGHPSGHSRKTIFDGYYSTANSNDSQNGYALSNLLKLRWFDLPKRMIGTVGGVALFKVNSFERSTRHDVTASLNLMSQSYSVRPINAPQKYT